MQCIVIMFLYILLYMQNYILLVSNWKKHNEAIKLQSRFNYNWCFRLQECSTDILISYWISS